LLALPLYLSRQFSVPFRFPLVFAFPTAFQATTQALSVAFDVLPIHEEVSALAGQCSVDVWDPVIVVKRIDRSGTRSVPSKVPKVALRLAF
jgi:hypothetical protein